MKKEANRERIGIFIILLVVFLSSMVGASEVVEQKTRKDVSIRWNGRNTKFALFQHAQNPLQWYCVNLNPEIDEYERAGKKIPAFSLIKFQRTDMKKPDTFIEGARMSFTFKLSPEQDVLDKLKQKLPFDVRKKGNLRLDPLPVEGMKLILKSPRGKDVEAVASESVGLGQKNSSQRVTFVLTLDDMNSDLVEEIIGDGLGVQFKLQYNLFFMGKPQKLNVKVNWDKIERQLGRKNFDVSRYVKVKGSSGVELDKRTLRLIEQQARASQKSRMKSSKSIFNEPRPGSSSKDDKKAGSIRDRKRGPSSRDRNYRSRSRKKTAQMELERYEKAGGFIDVEGQLSLAKYPKKIRESLVFNETSRTGIWKMVYLPLPPIDAPPELAVEKVDLSVTLLKGSRVIERQKYIWKHGQGWRDIKDVPVIYGRFELPGKFEDFEKLRFRIQSVLKEETGDVLEGDKYIPAILGDTPISDPFHIADIACLDFSALDFNVPEENGDKHLRFIDVKLQEGDRVYSKRIMPVEDDEELLPPPPIYWFVSTADCAKPLPVVAEIVFYYSVYGDHFPVEWSYNGEDLREAFGAPVVVFTQEDWKGFPEN